MWPEVDDLPHDMWVGTLCHWFGKVYFVMKNFIIGFGMIPVLREKEQKELQFNID